MSKTIGKYKILETIGRGGMGIVFKGYHPLLNRPVALKVISRDDEIDDELKARFYREAQACAGLSHPNIVVVHDMGEEEGRLYIVMEFLDGEDLKRIIDQRRRISLEDKLSMMIQICDGLHYAHQNGVIHRDIKPGNIFVLRNGQVKIVDFGLARVATTDPDLTKTGMIMGTFRYMSPEQSKPHARVDHRSDIFSAGVVFYELLAHRPAFDSTDPLETIRQVRTENPPPLAGIDPSIPMEVISVVETAMRKDPADRFPDLGHMRVELEDVRWSLMDEAKRLRANVRNQIRQIGELQAQRHRSSDDSSEDDTDTIPAVDDRAGAGDLRLLEHELARRITALRAAAGAAEAAQVLAIHAGELVERGEFPAAILEFEQALRDAPSDPQIQEALRRARSRQDEVNRLLDEARAAHEGHEYGRCLELLAGLPSAATTRAATLREAAETAKREQEQAVAAHDAMASARTAAERAQARRQAAPAWTAAETKESDANQALRRHDYGIARAGFQEAARDYDYAARRAVDNALAVQARAEAAHRSAAEARARASGEAPTRASDKWAAAGQSEAVAQSALGRKDYAAAESAFKEARRIYEEAAEAATRLIEAEVDRLTLSVAAARRAAEEVGAGQRASEAFAAAKAAERTGTDAIGRHALREALGHLSVAEQAYQEAARLAAAEATSARRKAEQAALEASQARQAAATLNPASHASSAPGWAAAQAREAAARRAFGQRDWVVALTLFGDARRLYEEAGRDSRGAAAEEARTDRLAEKRKRGFGSQNLWIGAAASVLLIIAVYYGWSWIRTPPSPSQRQAETDPLLAQVQRAQKDTAGARDDAVKSQAEKLAPASWSAARDKEREADAAFGKGDLARAQTGYAEALAAYAKATKDALDVLTGERREAAEAADNATKSRRVAEQAEAQKYSGKRFAAAQERENDGSRALRREEYGSAKARFREAQQEYDNAAKEARAVVKDLMDKARSQAVATREQAEKSEADKLARDLYDAARGKEAQADGFAGRQQYAEATANYQDAQKGYLAAKVEADNKRAGLAQQARALMETARKDALGSRDQARQSEAEKYAKELFDAARGKEAQADGFAGRQQYAEATANYQDAQKGYLAAKEEADKKRPSPGLGPNEEIRAVLEAYRQALERKDVVALQRLKPNLSEADVRKLRAAFDEMKSLSVELRVDSIQVRDNEAEAKGHRTDVGVPNRGGREQRSQMPFTFKFRRSPNGWVME
jgi:serine/threonine protein kinase